jgi:hypothetical protein
VLFGVVIDEYGTDVFKMIYFAYAIGRRLAWGVDELAPEKCKKRARDLR